MDVAVLLNGRPGDETCFDRRLEIMGGLMDILHINDVGVLILNQTPPALCYAVLRDGILLFCRDPQVRIMFQVQTLNAYLDFKPILKRHEDALLEKARKGELSRGYNPYQSALERYRQVRERIAHPQKPGV
ncbi:MAG: nucleotidyltransferase domain-containing protein [Chloroflexota bacterium]